MDYRFMKMAHELADKSHCLNRKVGAVLVSYDHCNIVTAVNDPLPHPSICLDQGCLRKQNNIPSGTNNEFCRCIHCETNLIAKCAKMGISTAGATVYTTLYPCLSCAKTLVAAGISKLLYASQYPDQRAHDYLNNSNISIEQLTLEDYTVSALSNTP